MSLDDPRPRRAAISADGPLEGRCLNTVTSITGNLYVGVPVFDGTEHKFGPVVWSAHPDHSGDVEVTHYPSKGDACLMLRGPSGLWWVLEWKAGPL